MVFCEGSASEPDYIKGLRRLPEIRDSTSITVEIDPEQGVPRTLVQRAVERSRDPEIDECWCVFDVEWPKHHPRLPETLELAEAHGIRLAISNPCFELWLILHFEDQSSFLSTDQAERRSRRLDGRPGKRIDPDAYLTRRTIAVQRASALSMKHARVGTAFPNDNPSSGMGDLLAAIETGLITAHEATPRGQRRGGRGRPRSGH